MPSWSLVVDDNFSRSNTSAGSAGTTTGAGNNWTDVQGGVYNINSDQLIGTPDSVNSGQYTRDFLARPSGENETDQQIIFDTVCPSTSGWSGAINSVFRLQSNSNHDCYIALMDLTQVAFFSYVGGTLTQLKTASCTPTAGHTYELTGYVYGTSPTNYSVTLVDTTTSTTLGSVSGTDSTSGLQTSGMYGLNINGNTVPANVAYTRVRTYNDAGPGMSVSPITATTSSSEGITLTGSGTSWTSGTTFSISGSGTTGATLTGVSATGTTNIAPTTFNSGTQVATFTLNPGSTAGTLTITDSTNSTSTTVAVSLPQINISPTSSARLESPGYWVNASGGRSGGTSRRTWRVGSWVKYYWSTTSGSPTCTLNMSNGTSGSELLIFINGVPTDSISVPSSGGINLSSYLSGANTYVLEIWYRNSQLYSRWNYTNALTDAGLTLDGNATPGTAPALRHYVLLVGDSITEGIGANNGSDDNADSYSFLLGRTLNQLGYDYTLDACGSRGFLTLGDVTPDVPAWYYVSGGTYQSGSSAWNLIDASTSVLDSNSQLSAYGATGTTPSLILVNFGSNEAFQGKSTSDLTAAVTQSLAALRLAAPAAQIRVILFFAAYTGSASPNVMSQGTAATYATAIRTGVTNYQSTYPGDMNTALIDLGSDTSTYLMALNSNNIHPCLPGHAVAAAALAGVIGKALSPVAAGPGVVRANSYSFLG